MDSKGKIVLITGGSGLIGTALTKLLQDEGYTVRYLSRNPQKISRVPAFLWNVEEHYIDLKAFENVDIVVHLAGENIAHGRWTKRRKELIYKSRVEGAKLILSYKSRYNLGFKAFISSSAIGFYGTFNSEEIFTEDSPAGDDFLARVAQEWEEAVWEFYKNGVRVGIVRTGVVLAPNGGLMQKLLPLARLGLLSPLGSGKQYVPWIHIDDLLRIYLMLIRSDQSDVFNGVAPQFDTFADLVHELMKLLGKKVWLPNVPEFAVKLLFGEMSSIMLYGSRVSAEKLLKAGFEFKFGDLTTALRDILTQVENMKH